MKSLMAEYFDEGFYALSEEARNSGMSPLDHYLKIGERLGVAPSAKFDPKYYAETYPDVATSKSGLLSHYVRYGRHEGRVPVRPRFDIELATAGIRPRRSTILFIVHEATRTGAPFLAWNLIGQLSKKYNVVTVLLKGGPIEAELQEVSAALIRIPEEMVHLSEDAAALLRKVIAVYSPRYAIANTSVTRDLAVTLERIGLPAIALIHEFSSDRQPIGCMHGLFKYVSKVVFPAPIVAESYEKDYYMLRTREHHVLAQGVTKHPQLEARKADREADVLPPIPRDAFMVLGLGTVTYRKGVDLFISTAAELFRHDETRTFAFVWAGHNFPFDRMYKVYLQEQIARCGLSDRVFLIDEVRDVRPLYKRADAMILSSRLDPLPNVAIDAALSGKPVVCFDGASGTADILKNDKRTRSLVVPHQDVAAAARVVLRLSRDKKYRDGVSGAIREIGKASFDMKRYVASLERLGAECQQDMAQHRRDCEIIRRAGVFNSSLCFGTQENQSNDEELIVRYLREAHLARPLERAGSGLRLRRPMLGFNPLIYASDNPKFHQVRQDPLAHFLLSGQPEGRWKHQVISPREGERYAATDLRVAMHGHFHYPDLLGDFLDRLSLNAAPVDLYLTTTGKDEAAQIERTLKTRKIRAAEVRIVPNRGRDIGAFLGLLGRQLANYDVIGHMHGKKSPHVAAQIGDGWRDFSFQHLIGARYPMADIVLSNFASDPTLGLVFPEDPHLNDWDQNARLGAELARRMRIRQPLPAHFDFPIGTMFWARPAALKPLLDLKLNWNDFPREPLPIDGTIIHAIERLVGFAASKAGFSYATTHVPGSVR